MKSIILWIHKEIFSNVYKKIIYLLQPSIFNVPKAACGREGDGRYIIPNEPNLINDAILLSFGVNDDISFEKDFLAKSKNSTVFCFDPTIEKLPEENNDIGFYKVGLSGKENKEKSLFTMDTIFDKLSLSASSKKVLKIDIEGWEWSTFENLLQKDINIDLIVVEFHFLLFNTTAEKIFFPVYFLRRYRILKKLLLHYSIFHIHANNYKYLFFRKFVFPEVIELTLIKRDRFIKNLAKEINELNTPNCHDKIDIQYPFIKELE